MSNPLRMPPEATSCDLRQRLPHADQRFLGRDTPIGKGSTVRFALLVARCASTADQEVPPLPATSMAVTPALCNRLATSTEIPLPTSLTTTGTSSSPANRGDLFRQSLEVTIALGLHRFLQHIEMQDQRIGADHLDGAPAMIDGIAVVELHRAEIAEQQNVRRDIAHLETNRRPMALRWQPAGSRRPWRCPDSCAAAARLRLTLRARSKPPVIEEIKIGAWSCLAEKRRADIDLVEIELRAERCGRSDSDRARCWNGC